MPGDHFYTTDRSGEHAPETGYEFEGAACFVLGTQSPGSQPLFRWFNPGFQNHFYTIDPGREALAGYNFQDVKCYVFPELGPNTVPLLRWLNITNGHHFYTIDPNRQLGPSAGYMFEGIACHVFPIQQPNNTPLYRWFQNGFLSNSHLTKRFHARIDSVSCNEMLLHSSEFDSAVQHYTFKSGRIF